MLDENGCVVAPPAAGRGCHAYHHPSEVRPAAPSPFASLSQRLLALRLARCLNPAQPIPSDFDRRTHRFMALALSTLFLGTSGALAEPPFGDLPPAIAKQRTSASVPADLPDSRSDPCAVYSGITVFVPGRGSAVAAIDPASLAEAEGLPCRDRSTTLPDDVGRE